MNREDFDILKDSNMVYFDNGATTLKPNVVKNKITEYYDKYTSNIHRGDYKNSLKVSGMYDEVRKVISDFIGADHPSEIVFTSGTTESINDIVFGYFKYKLHSGDEVLITFTFKVNSRGDGSTTVSLDELSESNKRKYGYR